MESGLGLDQSCWRKALEEVRKLNPHVHLPDSAAVQEAAELIERFGGFAADEAGARASRSRDLGNVVHYCRWRQIERLIQVLSSPGGGATLH